MSVSVHKAKALLKTLRWYHVGFAFFWATTFAGLSYSAAPDAAGLGIYKVSNQACVIVTVIVMALVVRMRGRLVPHPRLALVPGVLLGMGVLLFYLAFRYGFPSLALTLLAGLCVGVASGLFYIFWQFFFTSEGASRTALYIPLSAVTSAVVCFAIQMLPPFVEAICVIVLLPALAAWSLVCALREVELLEPEMPLACKVSDVVRDMWKPVFCVCAIGLVWKLVSYLFEGSDASTLSVVLFGFSAAALVIAAVELFSERGFEVLRSYQVLFPLITGAFLLPAVLGMQFAPILSGTLMFGFEIVNLLLIITCAIYANERAMPSTYVYALCMGPTFVAMLAGDMLGMRLSATVAYDLSLVVGILFACVYVLSCTMLLASWTRRRRQGDRGAIEGEEAGEFGGEQLSVGRGPAGVSAPASRRTSTRASAAVSASPYASTSTSTSPSTSTSTSASPSASAPAPGSLSAAVSASPSASAPASEMDVAALEEALIASISAKFEAMEVADPLSQREREVAALVVRGFSVAAMSRRLFISENTVRGHTKSIYRKLGVHSKQQLIDLVGV